MCCTGDRCPACQTNFFPKGTPEVHPHDTPRILRMRTYASHYTQVDGSRQGRGRGIATANIQSTEILEPSSPCNLTQPLTGAGTETTCQAQLIVPRTGSVNLERGEKAWHPPGVVTCAVPHRTPIIHGVGRPIGDGLRADITPRVPPSPLVCLGILFTPTESLSASPLRCAVRAPTFLNTAAPPPTYRAT
jgi:hypothetical protein